MEISLRSDNLSIGKASEMDYWGVSQGWRKNTHMGALATGYYLVLTLGALVIGIVAN